MFNSFDNRITDLEKMLSDSYSPEEAKAYLNSLRVKFMTVEEKSEYAQIAEEESKPEGKRDQKLIDSLKTKLGIK